MSSTGPRTEVTRSIYAYIKANAPVTQASLYAHFRPQAAADGMSIGRWLKGRIEHMEHAGYIAWTALGWTASEIPPAMNAATHCTRGPRKPAEPPVGTSVATPRRVSMFGPSYVPPVQSLRAGATDYAAAPSVINGEPRPYRRAW